MKIPPESKTAALHHLLQAMIDNSETNQSFYDSKVLELIERYSNEFDILKVSLLITKTM